MVDDFYPISSASTFMDKPKGFSRPTLESRIQLTNFTWLLGLLSNTGRKQLRSHKPEEMTAKQDQQPEDEACVQQDLPGICFPQLLSMAFCSL